MSGYNSISVVSPIDKQLPRRIPHFSPTSGRTFAVAIPTMYYLLFVEKSTGIVLNPDAQTRNQSGNDDDLYVPVATMTEADTKAREVFQRTDTVEISLYNEEKQYLQKLLP